MSQRKAESSRTTILVRRIKSNVLEFYKKMFRSKIVYRKMCVKMCGVCRGEYQLIGVGARGTAKV